VYTLPNLPRLREWLARREHRLWLQERRLLLRDSQFLQCLRENIDAYVVSHRGTHRLYDLLLVKVNRCSITFTRLISIGTF
jgi:hypothetical protein